MENRLEQIRATTSDPRLHERGPQREPHPIVGWPLKPLALLDREGARGCLADLATAGLLSRQAVFVVLACADLSDPGRFLAQLEITTPGAAGVGEALRMRSTRDLIGATFAVPAGAVPAGYLRALLRVSEGREAELGRYALAEPGAYRRLWQIGYRAMWAAKGEAAIRTVVDTARLTGASPFRTILKTVGA